MLEQDPILQILNRPKDAVFSTASRMLAERFPGRKILETEEKYFRPDDPEGQWDFSPSSIDGHWCQMPLEWSVRAEAHYDESGNGWYECEWGGQRFQLLRIGLAGKYCETVRWFVVPEVGEDATEFFDAVCRWHSTVRGKILVFQHGQWSGDQELYRAVQNSHLDELVLHGKLKEEIVSDLTDFLNQETTYNKYKLPWKRGILFLGPPGNGKTHLIRALMSNFDKPCLYVKSFQSPHMPPQINISRVFARAREVTPCFLIFEDLDTLLDGGSRSFFLNEMDGFASNHGIVSIATCNYPEKLDPAITERPSRFDRKYHFELPEIEDRRRYLSHFSERFEPELRLDEAGLAAVAEATHGYSYAYLKELYVSSAIRWISTDRGRPIFEVMVSQAETLREQMTTEWSEGPPETSKKDFRRFLPPGFEMPDFD